MAAERLKERMGGALLRLQALEEIFTFDFTCSQQLEVWGQLLDVDPRRATFSEMRNQMQDADLGAVVDPVKHTLPGKYATGGDTIEAGDQGSAVPHFDAMGLAAAMEFGVGGDHGRRYPCAALTWSGRGRARANYAAKSAINGELLIGEVSQRATEVSRDVKFGKLQNRAARWANPRDRAEQPGVRPRKDSAPIGGDEPFG